MPLAIIEDLPKNLSQALDMGYRETAITREIGYISRKNFNELEAPIKVARGRRSGQLYYSSPAYDSTRYCFRHYLALQSTS